MKKERISPFVSKRKLAGIRTDGFSSAPHIALKKTDSTNVRLKALAERGAIEGTLITARTQTAGKGRRGRKFHSPKGNGLYFSLLLRPQILAESAGLITTAAAVAVCRALEGLGAEDLAIKWVNDVYFRGKKICGVLTESKAESGSISYAVLGVGINLTAPKGGFPEELKDIAGGAFDFPVDKNAVLSAFLSEFSTLYQTLANAPHREEYARRMLYVNAPAYLHTPTETFPVTVLGITQTFALRVRLENGEVREISAGEVSLRPQV